MAQIWKSFVKQTVTGTPGTGAFTLSAAVSGFQALDRGDDGGTGVFVAVEGTAWETFWGTYTHSGTSLARTSRDESSTGSAISFTSAAVVYLDIVAMAARAMSIASQAVIPGGRLSLTSGVPVTTADVIGATSVFWTPNGTNGGILPLWDDRIWLPRPIPEFAGALGTKTSALLYDDFGVPSLLTPSSTNTSTDVVTFGSAHNLLTGAHCRPTDTIGGLTTGTDYWVNVASGTTLTFHTTLANALAGTSKVDLTANITQAIQFVSHEHVAWTNGSTRASDVTIADRYCKSADKTRLYLGTFYTTSTTTTEDSAGGTTSQVGGKRFLWNMYNRVRRGGGVIDTTDNWSYTALTIRQANGASGNKVEFVLGMAEDVVTAEVRAAAYLSNVAQDARSAPGLNSTTAFNVTGNLWAPGYNTGSAGYFPMGGRYSGLPAAGYNYISWNESGADNICAFLGDNNGDSQTGLAVELFA